MLTAYLVDRARRDAETLLLCPQFGTLAGAARSAAFGGWPAAGFLSGARLCGGPLARPCMLGQHRGGSGATGWVGGGGGVGDRVLTGQAYSTWEQPATLCSSQGISF